MTPELQPVLAVFEDPRDYRVHLDVGVVIGIEPDEQELRALWLAALPRLVLE
jgi:hypothetical protein